ncbi:MAG: hypothetical protein AB7E09_05995 [Candidatus Izemoplasmatales bacterium]
MICKLCKTYFLDVFSFDRWFDFPDLCPSCKDKFQVSIHFESIPIDNGQIDYYYIYDDLSLNTHEDIYLSRYLDRLYLKILDVEDTYDLFIYYDDLLDHTFYELGPLIKDYRKVFFFSLMRKDLIYKDIFL